MMGEWRLRANRKTELTSQFGSEVTQDLNLRVAAGTNVVVGFGRMNPNAARGRKKRGKRKKGQLRDVVLRS